MEHALFLLRLWSVMRLFGFVGKVCLEAWEWLGRRKRARWCHDNRITDEAAAGR